MGVCDASSRRHALSDRKDDLYETPDVAVRALLAHCDVPQCVWEPACGPGAIVRELRASGREVVATDLIDYGLSGALAGWDFLLEREAPEGVQAIVTNPPFKLANEFAAHAIRLVPMVAMLLRLSFLEAGDENGRRRTQRERAFALDGGMLERVIVFRKRLPMMHRAGWEGPRNGSSGLAFAWFVWRREHVGPATIDRISWEPFVEERNARRREGDD